MSARKRFLAGPVAGLAVVIVLVVAGCGSSSSAATTNTPASTPAAGGANTTNVTIQNFAFTPQTLTVSAGTKVTWTNKDPVPHDVTSANNISTSATPTNLFTSGTLSQGQSFSFTFTKPGTYFYECKIHFSLPAMHAKVVVK